VKIITGKVIEPRKIVMYGPDGVGKTKWAASAPAPFFLDMEGGCGRFDVARTERMMDFSAFQGAMSWLMENKTEYRTLVIDTADWLNQLIAKDVCERHNQTNLAKVLGGYGKGFEIVAEEWGKITRALDGIRLNKGMAIIVLAHAQAVKVNNPESDVYEQWGLDLHKDSAGILREWADEVLFAGFRVLTKSEDLGFNKERRRAIGEGERYVRTSMSPSAQAKNRIDGMPAELPLDFSAYAAWLPRRETVTTSPAVSPAGNINGIVNNGSSKTPAA